MNNDDLADVIRGNIKFVDIEAVIDKHYNKLQQLVEPYVDEKRKLYLEQLHSDPKEIWTSEPDWPKGQIKTNSQRFNRLKEQLWRWQRLREDLFQLAFDMDPVDCLDDFEIQPIAIKLVKT